MPPIGNTNIAAFHISETLPQYYLNAYNSLHETWYVYIMPPEARSFAYMINLSHQ
jgi:hypothetical protein